MRRLARSFSEQDISFSWPRQVICFLFKWPRQDIYFLNGQRKIYITDYRYTLQITFPHGQYKIYFSSSQYMIYFKLYFHAAFSQPSTSNSRLDRRRCSGSCFFFVKESHNHEKKPVALIFSEMNTNRK